MNLRWRRDTIVLLRPAVYLNREAVAGLSDSDFGQ